MTPLDWFKKEKPLLGLLGSGGGASIGAATFEPITVRYILVGGGGAGGSAQGGGGGGAGAVRYANIELEGGVNHPYQVGGGGAPYPYNPGGPVPSNCDGDQSWFSSPTITAGYGGGGGSQGADPTGTGEEDHGRVGGDLGGCGGGGGIKDYTAASPGGPAAPVTGHPDINHPQGSKYGGGNGFAGPGGGSGNRGGGGGGSADHGYSAGHGGPVNGGPTQNPGSRMTGGEGAPGFEMPGTYLPNASMPQLVDLQPTAYGYNGYSTTIPSPQNMLGMREPTVPTTYRAYFGGGGGGGTERSTGGNGGSGPDFAANGNYGGGGNGAGAPGYDLPQTGSKGAPGLNGRGGGGGGGAPYSMYAGGAPSNTPNLGHAGGSGVLIIQYPKARTAVATQPTYTNIITTAPDPEGHSYFIAIGPAGPTKGFSFPHPGQGDIKFE